MKKKIITKIIGFCVLVPVIIGIFVFLSVSAGIGLEFLCVKWDIDNPHVDNYFEGWKMVSIDGLDDFRIPEEWTLKQESENVYCIYDESGQVWARGAFYSKDNYIQVLEHLLSLQITEITFEDFISIYMMDGSDTGQITVHSDDIPESYQEIRFFIKEGAGFVWILENDISIDEQQRDIAEAIQYSYAFQK